MPGWRRLMARRFLLDTDIAVDVGLGGLDAMPVKVRRILQDPDVELIISTALVDDIPLISRDKRLENTRDYI